MKRALAALAVVATAATAVLVMPTFASASDASYWSLNTASNPDWMRPLPDSRSLAALSIPGTHETLASFGGAWTQTQEDYGSSGGGLAKQLGAGIRAIDVRARIQSGNTLVIHHGSSYQNANFDDVLNKIGDFLKAHSGETVLLRLKQECTGQTGSCTDVSGQLPFPDIFDKYAAARPNLFWQPSINRNTAAAAPTLGQARGKIVLLVMNGAFGGRWHSYGLAQFADWKDGSSTYVQDEYNVPNVGAIATKRDQARRFLDSTNSGDSSKVYVNFASGASVLAQPQSVAGGAWLVWPFSWQQGVDPFLLTYMNEGHGLTRTGVIMMDFPGGGLINKIISYNR